MICLFKDPYPKNRKMLPGKEMIQESGDCKRYFYFYTSLMFRSFIFSSFGFWCFGHFSCVIFFTFLFRLIHLALQNVNKDYVIFLYFRNFIAKNDKKPKTKNGIIKTNVVTFDKNKHLRTVCILKPQAVPSSFRRFAAAENEQ